MAITVLDSKDQLKALQTGQIPVPPEVQEDNTGAKPAEPPPQEPAKAPDKETPAEPAEDDDGLTEAQRKEFTKNMQKTVSRKHRQMREAEEFAAAQYNLARLAQQNQERLERENKRLTEELKQAKPADEDAGKPKRENFATDDEFRDAMDDWRLDQKWQKRVADEEKQRAEARQAEMVANAKARIARALELVPDFEEVTEAVDMEVPPTVAGYMQKSEMFAELGYHFAKQPEVLERLHKLAPDEQLVEVGKILSTLQPFASSDAATTKPAKANGKEPSRKTSDVEKPAATSPQSSSQAAAPEAPAAGARAAVITPLATGSATQVEKPVAEMNIREHISDWQKKRGTHLERRKRN